MLKEQKLSEMFIWVYLLAAVLAAIFMIR